MQCAAEVQMCRRVAWPKGQRLPERGRRLAMAAAPHQRLAKVHAQIGSVGRQRNRPAIDIDRLVASTAGRQGVAQIEQRFDARRPQLEGTLGKPPGALHASCSDLVGRSIDQRLVAPAVERQTRVETRARLVVPSAAGQRQAEKVSDLRIGRRSLKGRSKCLRRLRVQASRKS
jgi:hypothetical protein